MSRYVITGAASGMGAATATLLRARGHQVIGVDARDADVVADLGAPAGRKAAVEAVRARCAGSLDGVALFAGVGGATGRPGSLLVSVNYFGSVVLLDAFRPLLAASGEGRAVAISSNSTTIQPGWSQELVDACLSGDESLARTVADRGDSITAYPATKVALARWVRRHAPSAEWARSGIRLNAVSPGLVETPLIDALRADPLLAGAVDALPLPLGRGGTAAELAEFVAFLLSPAASFFVGSLIVCDGGSEALLRPDDWPARWDVRR